MTQKKAIALFLGQMIIHASSVGGALGSETTLRFTRSTSVDRCIQFAYI
ncbi:hypothetical protein [uncultured Nostoc sp.]